MHRLAVRSILCFTLASSAAAQTAPQQVGPTPLVEKPLRFGARLGINVATISFDPSGDH